MTLCSLYQIRRPSQIWAPSKENIEAAQTASGQDGENIGSVGPLHRDCAGEVSYMH
jgi:hypothetical protein